jgi:hypothetical protein
MSIAVPTTAPTVTEDKAIVEVRTDVQQLADDADVQCVVPHTDSVKDTEMENSVLPKFKPVTVTEWPPEPGRLLGINETTAASKLKVLYAVPAVAETVIAFMFTAKFPLEEALRHCTAVLLLHDAVAHTPCKSTVEAVTFVAAKLRPVTVTEAPPLTATFHILAADPTGASNVKDDLPVPLTAPTVTMRRDSAPEPMVGIHNRAVLASHVSVLHCCS